MPGIKAKIKAVKKRSGIKAKFQPRPIEAPEVIAARWEKKKDRIHQLAHNISRLRLNVTKSLKSEDEKEFLTALIIAIIDKTGERIGNNESASEGHHGVSGFLKKHISIKGNEVTLTYTGKSGVDQEKIFNSEKIAKGLKEAIKNSTDKRVFTTTEGQWIGSEQVTRYLKDFDVTAKDLRGYFVNQAVAEKLSSLDIPEKENDRKKLFNKTCKQVAARVGHGSGTCKKHYIVPELPEQYITHGKIIDLKSQNYYKEGGKLEIPISEEFSEDLISLLGDKGKTDAIGEELGQKIENGISKYISPHGSYRYVKYIDGKAVSVLQIMSLDAIKGTVANVYTLPQYRRKGFSKELWDRATKDFKSINHSSFLNKSGEGFKIFTERKVKKLFGGEIEKAPNYDKLPQAKEMLNSNTDLDIWKRTGWIYNGNDNKWRFEIGDKNSELKMSTSKLVDNFNKDVYYYSLSDILEHEDFYYLYPEAKEILFAISINPLGEELLEGESFTTKDGRYIIILKIKKLESYETISTNHEGSQRLHRKSKAIIIHELQHFLQKRHSFGKAEGNDTINRIIQRIGRETQLRASSLEEGPSRNRLLEIIEEINKNRSIISYLIYWFQPAELEAFNVYHRSDLTKHQRKEIPPYPLPGFESIYYNKPHFAFGGEINPIGGNYQFHNKFGSFTSIKIMPVDENLRASKDYFTVEVTVRSKGPDEQIIIQAPKYKTFHISRYKEYISDLKSRGVDIKMESGGQVNGLSVIKRRELEHMLEHSYYGKRYKLGGLFHGSHKKFTKFSLSNVGEGGKSVGGWGIYLSTSIEVANQYLLKSGALYEVTVFENGEWLDLDEQIPDNIGSNIIRGLQRKKISEETIEQFKKDYLAQGDYGYEVANGKQVYDYLSDVLGSEKKASEFLLSMGVIGNRFKDKTMPEETNYVVFDASEIRIDDDNVERFENGGVMPESIKSGINKIKQRELLASKKYLSGGITPLKETIDDSEYRFIKEINDIELKKEYFLEEIIRHNKLFEKHPHFRKIIIIFEDIIDEDQESDSEIIFKNDKIQNIKIGIHFSYYKKHNYEKFAIFRTSYPEFSKEAVLLHEIEHATQFEERGFAGRGYDEILRITLQNIFHQTREEAEQRGIWSEIEKQADYFYKRQSTEQEAMWVVDEWLKKIGLKYGIRNVLLFDNPEIFKYIQQNKSEVYYYGGSIPLPDPKDEFEKGGEGLKFKKLFENVFIVTSYSQQKLAKLFVRLNSYLDSREFKGKIFTLDEFKSYYIKEKGAFTYYDDYTGFNIPDHVIDVFMGGSFNPLSEEEKWLLDNLKSNISHKPYYIIGYVSVEGQEETRHHEFAHALYYLSPAYKKEVDTIINKFWRDISSKSFNNVQRFLKELEYDKSIWDDEMNAYLIGGKKYLTSKHVWGEEFDRCRKILEEIFERNYLNTFGKAFNENLDTNFIKEREILAHGGIIKYREAIAKKKYLGGGKFDYTETIDDIDYHFIIGMNEIVLKKQYFLDQVIKHDKLFEKYPKFKEIIVIFEEVPENQDKTESVAIFDIDPIRRINKIVVRLHFNFYKKHQYEKFELRRNYFPEYSKEGLLLHELEHVLQFENRWISGFGNKRAISVTCRRFACNDLEDAERKGIRTRVEKIARILYLAQHIEQDARWTVDVWLKKINLSYGDREELFYDNPIYWGRLQNIFKKRGYACGGTIRHRKTLSQIHSYVEGGEIDSKLKALGFTYSPHSYRFHKQVNPNKQISAFYNKNKNLYSIRGNVKFDTVLGGNSVGISFDYNNEKEFWDKINELISQDENKMSEGGEVPNIQKVKSFTTSEGKFSVYDVEKDVRGRADMFTVYEDRNGWIVRNALVPEYLQKKGIATRFYRKMNEESLKKTNKPLRSTQPRTLLTGEAVHELSKDGIRLWDSLVKKGYAEKISEKNYVMIDSHKKYEAGSKIKERELLAGMNIIKRREYLAKQKLGI